MKVRLLILSFLCGYCVYSNTIYVSNSNDSGIGSLRHAIAFSSATDTIRFDPLVFLNGLNDTIELDSTIFITHPVSIIGVLNSSDTTFISGKQICQIFNYTYSSPSFNSTIDSVFLIHGSSATLGGAIYYNTLDTLKLFNCGFLENDANIGAAVCSNGNVLVNNCLFKGNISTSAGSAINMNGSYLSLLVLNSDFESNQSSSGTIHGLACNYLNLEIRSSYFMDNVATAQGGAIRVQSSNNTNFKIVDNIFSNNFAEDFGGAVVINGCANAMIDFDGNTFSNNSSNYSAGAVQIHANYSTLEISNCIFDNNQSFHFGGAILINTNQGIQVEIDSSLFFQNSVTDINSLGGGLFVHDLCLNPTNIYISNSTFIENSAMNEGGAILFEPQSGQLNITNSTFSNNTAKRGGAISSDDPILVYSSEFVGNYSTEYGGAISSSNFNISNSTFKHNYSNYGGAISNQFPIHTAFLGTIMNCEIDSNFALIDGGAMYCKTNNSGTTSLFLTIGRSTFYNNSAANNGGALFINPHSYGYPSGGSNGLINISESTISTNHSEQSGGGIYCTSTSPYAGVVKNSNLNITNSTITYNSNSNLQSGGIYASATNSNINIISSIIAFNDTISIFNSNPSTINSQGYNIFSDDLIIGVHSTDSLGVIPSILNLESIQNNGGGTMTHMPLQPSYAIDNGNPSNLDAAQNHIVVNAVRDIGSTESFCEFNVFDTVFVCFGESVLLNGTYSIANIQETFDTLFHVEYSFNCDTILNYFVDVLNEAHLYDTIYLCHGQSHLMPDGAEFLNINTSFNYQSYLTNTNGCDSVISTQIYLFPIQESFDSIYLCPHLNFIMPDGTEFLNIETPIYHESILTNVNGCDSLVYTNIYLFPEYEMYDTINVCFGDSFAFPDGSIYDNITSSFYQISYFSNQFSCDSSITTVVEVIEIDDTIFVQNDTIFVPAIANSYQWLICEPGIEEIIGATNNSFKPNSTGYYAAIITMGMCSDTTGCIYYEIDNSNLDHYEISSIYCLPNPGMDNISILNLDPDLLYNLQIFNSTGELIHESCTQNEKNIEINISSYSQGVYFIRISAPNTFHQIKLIKL